MRKQKCALFIGLFAVLSHGCGVLVDLPEADPTSTETGTTPDGNTGVGDGPSLTSSKPAADESDVTVESSLQLEFSEAIDPGSLVVRLFPERVLSAPSWSEDARVATLQPSEPLSRNMRYEVHISGRSQAGKDFQIPAYAFYTEGDAGLPVVARPVIVSTEPADGVAQVAPESGISIWFSLPMAPDSVQVAIEPAAELGPRSWSDNDTLLTYPSTELRADTRYTFTVTGKDVEGQELDGKTGFSFTTAPNPPPATPPAVASAIPRAGEVGVPRDRALSVTFTKAMDRAATEAAFVRPGGANGAFSWNAQSTVLTFRPAAPLGSGVTLNWGVGVGARDAQGTALARAFASSFRTAGRIIESTLPAVAALEGRINNGGKIVKLADTGAGNTTIQMGDGPEGVDRGFMTFDLGRLNGPVLSVVSAELSVYQPVRPFGDPYRFLGALQVASVDYGTSLDADDWGRAALGTPVQNLSTDGNVGFRRLNVSAKVRDDFANRSRRGNRSQFRFFFRFDFQNRDNFQDAAWLFSSVTGDPTLRPSLKVRYEVP